MHPALSVIFFTTASGAGYGLLTILGLGYLLHIVPDNFAFGLTAIGIALTLITTGLLSSTFHLGHPERAWRALSQWRSSWLSREGVLAIITYVPILVFASKWLIEESDDETYTLAAMSMSVLCVITVYATSMIYASLKTVHAWCNHWVPLAYLSLALMTGIVLLNALLLIFAPSVPLITYITLGSIVLALGIKV
ncbi:MAG: DMSO reductase anchor subunit, partial [Gammaproteobacteria bacterium]